MPGDAVFMSDQQGTAEVLSVSAAWALLREEAVGRVCVVVDGNRRFFR